MGNEQWQMEPLGLYLIRSKPHGYNQIMCEPGPQGAVRLWFRNESDGSP
jgi:hypothetical protein